MKKDEKSNEGVTDLEEEDKEQDWENRNGEREMKKLYKRKGKRDELGDTYVRGVNGKLLGRCSPFINVIIFFLIFKNAISSIHQKNSFKKFI